MKTRYFFFAVAIAFVMLLGYAAKTQAAESEPDVIHIDEDCKLIKLPQAEVKPPQMTKRKPKPFLVQHLKPPAPTASAPIKAKKKKRKPLYKKDIPDEYELECDETPPLLTRLVPPPDVPSEPAEPLPLLPEPVPDALPFPPLYVVPEVPTGEPEPTFAGPGYFPPSYGPPGVFLPPARPPVRLPPVTAVPEPHTWLLLLAGVACLVWRKRNLR